MVQSADFGKGHHLAAPRTLHLARDRGILAQSQMRPRPVTIDFP